MEALRCPVCKADNAQGPNCRRCKADLSPLFALEDARRRTLDEARAHAAAGRWSSFLSAASEADRMRSDGQTRRLRAVGLLLTRDFAEAARAARGASV